MGARINKRFRSILTAAAALAACLLLQLPVSSQAAGAQPGVSYQTHVQDIGWQGNVSNGGLAGTTGQSRRVEAVRISVANDSNLGISYQAHVQNVGWQGWTDDGATAGTTGQSLQMEALRIRLTGKEANQYDVYYCTHIQDYGWLNWTKNGQVSGSVGLSKRVEAVKVQILPKGSAAPVPVNGTKNNTAYGNVTAASGTPSVSYTSHVQNIGWQSEVQSDATTGTTGRGLHMEAIRLYPQNINANIVYKVHVANIGWQEEKTNGQIAGTTGKNLQMEAIQISLSGADAANYDIYYCAHVQDYGWLGWAKNGEITGTTGIGYRMEALKVRLVPKNSAAPARLGPYSHAYVNSKKILHEGIDVSKWQGEIDWAKVSQAKSFAMIRCNDHDKNVQKGIDPYFYKNMAGARSNGMNRGAYYYSTARTTAEAVQEADTAVAQIRQAGGVEMPVYIDQEDSSLKDLSNEERTTIVRAFCDRIKTAGYQTGVYSYTYWFEHRLNLDSLRDVDIWLSTRNKSEKPATLAGKSYSSKLWQYQVSQSGEVPGINGGVDLDYYSF